ncbi:5-formyltetrahydrofolate cyclo-ligase [Avibacterium paragallinarum]|uniref:5-formyltetrahydrofolate cyclo-ligase n=1 Tax=Avibacterium paragallinarum TaxID=728 RepID=UPI00021AD324|nr:5-formyltetrahydrofolate cyclo-ligase [Avibacterium paragallinarum]AZI13667.1 5-formyltetrahydrofolate cyclo-ligase [Avibacterium paragallinarum]QJE09161.1 5-formyltetrahydrofolate cyclo-ligase [Avibacterium paragallinarum]QJE11357.1 5-formyltetrahydrofolate cyclo-ligase [Avibacterium paragallinarum]QJE13555.1 5-formyltetrahydrofolate cyclo-ligase [Avibacterium paragallinarum]QJE15756.1 5-formyltetrahydrofolate cyclo-ligase [Avibacterium paragallinarum]
MNDIISFRQRKVIRQRVRHLRQMLTPQQQHLAEQKITEQSLRFIEKRQAKHIGIYLSFDGEISTKQLIQQLWNKNLAVYLPILHPFSAKSLLFLRYQPDTILRKNKFNILEPQLDVRNVIPTNKLDIIFTPLVAFDQQGNRLGMGGGFYDRTLQNWQTKNFLPIGLAHQCQQVEELPVESWDIPLFKILVA